MNDRTIIARPGEVRRRFSSTASNSAPAAGLRRRVLNMGSGPASSQRLHTIFRGWAEVRLDVDPKVKPDIVGSARDMRGAVADKSFDAVWSSHQLEHLHSFEIHDALGEFRRVLKADGFALVTCPDLEAIARFVLEKGLTATAYVSAAGPITALDMLYGHVRSVSEGNQFMSHKTGFTTETFGRAALDAGFAEIRVAQGDAFDLWALLLMPHTDARAMAALLASTPQQFLLET